MTEKKHNSGGETPQIPPLNIPENLTLRQALSVLADYAVSETLREDFGAALKENYGTDEAWERLSPNDRMAFLEFFIFDRPLLRWKKTPARIFAESVYGLSDDLRAKFIQLANATLDFYEITTSRENHIKLLSLGSEKSLTVADRQLGGSLKIGDIALARVVKWEGGLAFSGVVNIHRTRPRELAAHVRSVYAKLGSENWKAVMRMLPRNIWAKLHTIGETDKGREIRKEAAALSQADLIEQATSRLRASDFEAARAFIEEYNTRYPGSTEGSFLAGSASLHTGRYEEAREIFSRLAQQNPSNVSTRMNLAVSLSMLGKLEDALKEYQQCLLLSPATELLPAILNGIGYLASMLGDQLQSNKAFEQAAKLAQNDHAALSVIVTNLLQVDDFKLATKLLKRMIKLKPDEREQYVTLGDVQMRTDSAGGAIKSYSRAIALDEANVPLHRRLGDAYLRNGNDKLAIAAYMKYAAVFPGDPEIHNNIGIALGKLSMVKESAAAFEQALKLNPDHVSSLNNLARHMLSIGNIEKAKTLLARSVALAPDNPIVLELGFILAEEQRKREARGN